MLKRSLIQVAMEQIETDRIAKESFIDRLKNKLNRTLTTSTDIEQYLNSLKTFQTKEIHILRNVAWSRVFFDIYKEVNADSIIKTIKTNENYIKALEQEASSALKELKKIKFNTASDEIEKTITKFQKIKTDFDNKYPLFVVNSSVGNVATTNEKEIKKVIKATLDTITIDNDKFHEIGNDLYEFSWEYHNYQKTNKVENKAINVAIETLSSILERVFSCFHYHTYIIHGAYMFVRESVK